MEIVNGYTGTDNVTAEMDGGLYASLAGSGKYVLELGSKLACSVTSANQITIADGGVLINGRYGYIRQGATDTLTIDNGRTGYNRNDLVVAHYHAAALSGIESLNIEIVKGKESTGIAADPVLVEGNILSGDKDVYLPLYRLPITGINLGTPVKLFGTLMGLDSCASNIAAVGNSIKSLASRIKTPINTGIENHSNSYWKIYFKVTNNVCMLHVDGKNTADSWGSSRIGDWVIPQAYRPPFDISVVAAKGNVSNQGITRGVVKTNGEIWWNNLGGPQSMQSCVITFVWAIG